MGLVGRGNLCVAMISPLQGAGSAGHWSRVWKKGSIIYALKYKKILRVMKIMLMITYILWNFVFLVFIFTDAYNLKLGQPTFRN